MQISMDVIANIAVFVLTIPGVFLALRNNVRVAKWGPVLALASQPFWAYTQWIHGQYGALGSTIAMTIVFTDGIREKWIMKSWREIFQGFLPSRPVPVPLSDDDGV